MTLQKPDKNKIAFQIFPEKKERIDNNQCTTCGEDIEEEDFHNDLSKKEYSISGMCQQCQDEVFKQ